MTDERTQAQEEARVAMEAASALKFRPRVTVWDPTLGGPVGEDVTEDVVSLLDALIGSLDWGSGFLSDEEVAAVTRLAGLLAFELPRAHGGVR